MLWKLCLVECISTLSRSTFDYQWFRGDRNPFAHFSPRNETKGFLWYTQSIVFWIFNECCATGGRGVRDENCCCYDNPFDEFVKGIRTQKANLSIPRKGIWAQHINYSKIWASTKLNHMKLFCSLAFIARTTLGAEGEKKFCRLTPCG